MRLKPQQVPLCGGCVLTVQLDDDDDDVCCAEEEEEELECYLLFSGSTQRHVSSILRVSKVTVKAVCPAHNVCEQVMVKLCWARPGGPVDSHSQETLCFVQGIGLGSHDPQDLVLDKTNFLLDSTATQEELLLDAEQLPLGGCDSWEESLALNNFSTLHPRTAHTHIDGLMCHHTQPFTATDAQTHGDRNRCSKETNKKTWMDVSPLLDSCSVASQTQQLSSLLHLTASHSLRTVVPFLLWQSGGQEALRMDALGQTAVGVAESRGHQQLQELFTVYKASSHAQMEPNEQLHFYPEARVFQHHANLDTYTLTSAGCRQREEGTDTDGVQVEVDELRRLIQIHRDSKGKPGLTGTKTGALLNSASGWWLCSSRQPETGQEAGRTVLTTEEQGSPPSLDERAQGVEPAVVTHTFCTRGRLCQRQGAGGGPRTTPAADQSRKNKRRTAKTTRPAAESARHTPPEAGTGTAREGTKSTGSGPEKDRRGSAVVSVLGDRGASENQHGPEAKETPLPREPVSGDGTYIGGRAAALHTSTALEKQEAEGRKVDVLTHERATEAESPTERPDQVTSAPGSAAYRTVTMGQEQSQDPQESQPDLKEPGHPDSRSLQSGRRTSPRSLDAEQKPQRRLWRDGGWIRSTTGSPPHGVETVAKTVWYQGDDLDQDATEDSKRQEENPQSAWYGSDVMDERKLEQLEQAELGLNLHQAPGPSPTQLVEQGLSPRQQCATLSQPHATGAPPAPSHGLAAQRQEVQGSQPQEEVGSYCKGGGVEGGREEGGHTETTYSRNLEEKLGGEETGAKGRRKRRKKRQRRGGAEAKLSSSSIIESQSHSESLRELVPALGPQLDPDPKAQDLTGRGHIKFTSASEPVQDQEAMHPHSQSETQTRSSDRDITASESSSTGTTDHVRPGLTEPSQTEEKKQSLDPDSTTTASDLSQTSGGQETLEPSELQCQAAAGPGPQTETGTKAGSVSLGSTSPEELPLGHSDPLGLTEDWSLVECHEHRSRHVQCVCCVCSTEAEGLPCDGTALLQTQEVTDTTEEERAQQRLDQQLEEEPVDEEGGSEGEDMGERSGEEWSFSVRGKDYDFPSAHRNTRRSYEECLVATAAAVVTVAVASAAVILAPQQANDAPYANVQGVLNEPHPDLLCPQSEGNPQDQGQSRELQHRGEGPPVDSVERGGAALEGPGDSEHEAERYEGEVGTATLPLRRHSSPDPGAGESTGSEETGESQSSWPRVETAMSRNTEYVAEDEEDLVCDEDPDRVDTVDGWKERESDKMEQEREERRGGGASEDTFHKAEPVPAEHPESEESSRELTPPVQIQREGDHFYPFHPCPQSHPQPNTGTSCADVCPHREECVCVSHRCADSLTIRAELDDSVFKKPDPPSFAGLNGRVVSVSRCSLDHAVMQGSLRPSEAARSGATPDVAAPQTYRLSWKSETKDTGGGKTEGRGGKEEKEDQLPENLVSLANLRASVQSLSLIRRHSWEPGSTAADLDFIQHSSVKTSEEKSGEVKRALPPIHRRSMSWCPSTLLGPHQEPVDHKSYSLEDLEIQSGGGVQSPSPGLRIQEERLSVDRQDRGSPVSRTEEDQEADCNSMGSQTSHQVVSMTASCPAMFHHPTLTKSISMVIISHCDADGGSSLSSVSSSLGFSISEEPGPLRSNSEGRGGARISRTFSYLRNKMIKKGKEKERRGDKERENKEREKKSANIHANQHSFIPVSPSPSTSCQHCTRPLHKDALLCNNCGVHIHKSCRECVSVCTQSKAQLQQLGPEAAPGSGLQTRTKSTTSASSVSSSSSSSSRECMSTFTIPDDQLTVMFPWKNPSIFSPHGNLAKSISTSNIAGLEEVPLRGLKFLSQSSDSLHQGSKVNASTESLTDEGPELVDSQLMGQFECVMAELQNDSWSSSVDEKLLKTLKKDEIKRQDVIYELYQTEFHHVRTLKIMSEVYYKGLQREVQLETHTLDKIFPVLDDLLHTHTEFLSRLLETRRASSFPGPNSFVICQIGDVLVQQFSDCSAERMKRAYGKFCSRHRDAVSLYKDLQAKDKRFQAFIKRTMSSSIVRRLSIPECILLVTQRITKYPVLIQRILQHTKDSDKDHRDMCESLRCVKELITAVDRRVNEQEKKRRLREVHSRTDSKSIMRMRSGQMFAKEDLIRGRKLLHDGALQLKTSAGRLKDVRAVLLSDVLVFLQEKDQKYVFASLDQRSTVISLQDLIVREVANKERGLFLISAGIDRPEMVEVLVGSKEERNTWRRFIQDAMHCMDNDGDEGVPNETEKDRRQQESRAREIRELLWQKDQQIASLLEEKVHIFKELANCGSAPEDTHPPVRERMLFRATPDDVTKGEPIIQDALQEVDSLRSLVSRLGGTGCIAPAALTGGSKGPVCLPRRAETFGGFDSHQMISSKNGDKEEGEESLELCRTESDSVLKKGPTTSLQMLLKRNNEQIQLSVTHLQELLISLQALVVQQDLFVEDQRKTNSSRYSSYSSMSPCLKKQQATLQEEKRRTEREWELKERGLAKREERLRWKEEETRKMLQVLQEERESLQRKKEVYHTELERLKEAQRRLQRDTKALRTHQQTQPSGDQQTPPTTSENSTKHSPGSLDLDLDSGAEQLNKVELSSSTPTRETYLRIGSKRMGKNFHAFSSSSSKKPGTEKEFQLPSRLLQLTKPKEKKKKGRGGEETQTEDKVTSDSQNDGDIVFY